MDQVLHGSARTTPAVRRAIQASSESLVKLAARYGLDPKTVAKWRGHTTTEDAPMGPTNPVSTVLSPLEEAAAVAFRQRTLLPLDDCLYALQEAIPHLSRSALHRLFQRHGISRLPAEEVPDEAKKSSLRTTPSATSTSILPRCAPRTASSTSSWPLTAPASWPLPSCTPKLRRYGPPISGGASWRQYRMSSIKS